MTNPEVIPQDPRVEGGYEKIGFGLGPDARTRRIQILSWGITPDFN
jgi:hypothetical protein